MKIIVKIYGYGEETTRFELSRTRHYREAGHPTLRTIAKIGLVYVRQ